jgi:SAM-dependent methyltransferase
MRIQFRISVFLLLAGCAAWMLAPAELASQSASVKPGINDRWKAEEISPLVSTLEDETREIYREREKLAEVVAPRRGSVVADVGAGSGFMTELFARAVGPAGKVYAVDINARLLERIAANARKAGLANIFTVLAREDSSELPPSSVDLVFICDTYHHFEYPQKTMASIHRALRTGGELVVVEFVREQSRSPQWIFDHVRDGREAFVREITDAGFAPLPDPHVPFLKDNYVLRFRKAETASSLHARPEIALAALPAGGAR